MFFQDQLLDHLAADLGNLPLEITYAGFTRVVADNVTDRILADKQFLFLEPVVPDLLGQQVPHGYIDLFILGIAGNADNFHAIQQRTGNIHGICRCHKHRIRQVEVDFQVMVIESVVLFRVEHLE